MCGHDTDMDDDGDVARCAPLSSVAHHFWRVTLRAAQFTTSFRGRKKGERDEKQTARKEEREREPKPKGRAGGGGEGGSRFQSLDLDSDRWRCRRGYVQIKGHRTARGLPNDRRRRAVRRALQETAASLAVRDRSLLRKIAFLPEKPRMPSFFLPPPPPRPSICGICCSVCLLGD